MIVVKPFEEPQPEPRVPAQPQSEDPGNDPRVPETYPHHNQHPELPPSQLPKKKQKGIKRYVNLKFPESFKRPSVPSARHTENVGAEGLTAVSQVEGDPAVHREL